MTLIEDLKKPLNMVFLLLSIVGIGLSIFFYLNGRKTKSISYHVDEPSSLIYDSKNSSSTIKVIEKDSTPIRENVYILTGVIWNSGDMPISVEDVRQNMTLNLISAKRILDFKVIKQIDQEIAKFRLTKINDKSLALSWKYFDPGYAFKFQIIYIGSENPQFHLLGKILDIKEFIKLKYPTKINFLLTFGFVIICLILVVILTITSIFFIFKSKRAFSTLEIIILFVLPLFLMLCVGLIFFSEPIPTIPLT